MKKTINILCLENDLRDFELIQTMLEKGRISYRLKRVNSRADFIRALGGGGFDLILSDYRLPKYHGIDALRTAKELSPDTPFIFVSGVMGEEAVITGFTQGATDYLLKGKLTRLALSVRLALHEAENRKQRKRAEKIIEHQLAFDKLMNQVLNRFVTCDSSEIDTNIQKALQALAEFLAIEHAAVYVATSERDPWERKYEWAEPGFAASGTPGLLLEMFALNQQRLMAGEIIRINAPGECVPAAVECTFAETEGSLSILLLPIHSTGGSVYGGLGLHAHTRPAVWADWAILRIKMIGDAIAGTLERKQTEDELRQNVILMRNTLKASINSLSSAIEMRDPYTALHQERVAKIAGAIAETMGLPQEQQEGVRIAGIIHDIGKLSIPAEILSKPTKLTEIEYMLIKMHSEVGYTILSKIEFPWPIAEIVYQPSLQAGLRFECGNR